MDWTVPYACAHPITVSEGSSGGPEASLRIVSITTVFTIHTPLRVLLRPLVLPPITLRRTAVGSASNESFPQFTGVSGFSSPPLPKQHLPPKEGMRSDIWQFLFFGEER